MTKIKGILFDKDGTLIDFHSIWLPVSTRLADECMRKASLDPLDQPELKQALMRAIGVEGQHVLPEGILASGTTSDISKAFLDVFHHFLLIMPNEEAFTEWLTHTIYQLTHENIGQIKAIEGLQVLLETLVSKGFVIGVATADDSETTQLCLEKLGIKRYFKFIGTSDVYKKKPHPAMLQAFCEHFHFHSSEVVMVGDTPVDLNLAKNGQAGLAIGVLSGTGTVETLAPLADVLLSSASELVTQTGELIWERSVETETDKKIG